MKKIFRFLLSILLVCFCLDICIHKAEAANWIKLFKTNTHTWYIDTDSYNYDSSKNIVKCWYKAEEITTNKTFMNYSYFNIADKSAANKSFIVYEKNHDPVSHTFDYLEYTPIVPNSNLDMVYDIIEYCVSLDNKNIDWKFNQEYIPQPPSLNDPNWQEINGIKCYNYSSSKVWTILGNILCFIKINSQNDESSVLAFGLAKNGIIEQILPLPVIILAKDVNQPEINLAESNQKQLVIRCLFI